jgi:uncharacterized protein YjbJ (UPF0337 family)
MAINSMKLTSLGAVIVLTFCSFGAYAAESQESTLINKDQVNGRVDEAKGNVKEITGKIQSGYGDLKQDIKQNIKKNN